MHSGTRGVAANACSKVTAWYTRAGAARVINARTPAVTAPHILDRRYPTPVPPEANFRMYRLLVTIQLALVLGLASSTEAADEFQQQILPLLETYCITCHSTDEQAGELDLQRFQTLADVRQHPLVGQQMLDQLTLDEMPPKDSPQLSAAEKQRLTSWLRTTLDQIAIASAGDPGPVGLRRLSNAEYTYSIRDLTGVDTLDPAREFPADGGAGEGFTNAAAALVMSPTLLTKYLDAAKEVAEHAVLLPDTIAFSPSTSPNDWATERLTRIRDFYNRYTAAEGAMAVDLQGVKFDTNAGGRLPLERYLNALQAERESLKNGQTTLDSMAQAHDLNAKYLGLLWRALSQPQQSLLLRSLGEKWQAGTLTAADIRAWQQALWRFTSVGHIGKRNGPKQWQEPLSPLVDSSEIRHKLTAPPDGSDIVVYLAASPAGDGAEGDQAIWDRPRIVLPSGDELPLEQIGSLWQQLLERRAAIINRTADYLAAADAYEQASTATDIATLASSRGLDPQLLSAWLDLLGFGTESELAAESLITGRLERTADFDFIQGWTGADALSVLANSSANEVRIPGVMKPHSVAVHPAPNRSAIIAWRSPVAGKLAVSGQITHAHPECGNGIQWALELRRGRTRETLASGFSDGPRPVSLGTHDDLWIKSGDVVALVINPRSGNHSCDLTRIDWQLRVGDQQWDLAKEISPNILQGNPHVDGQGNADVWYFCSEPTDTLAPPAIPQRSLLAAWRAATTSDQRQLLAAQLQQWLQATPTDVAADAPDALLQQQLLSFQGPLMTSGWNRQTQPERTTADNGYGLDPASFGKHPNGAATVEARQLCVQAPSVLEVRLPAALVAGGELVVTGRLHTSSGGNGSVQLQVLGDRPSPAQAAGLPGLDPAFPLIVEPQGAARQRLEQAFDDFRQLFPIALCYTEIVPVDEVVTLTLYYREDEHLQRLMLDQQETAQLDRLWDELLFVSRAPLKLVDAFEQLYQYATQDSDPSAFEPMREPIQRSATAFAQRLLEVEPQQVEAVLEFASQAWRRPLNEHEQSELRALYQRLREQDLPHESAVRMLIVRVLAAPNFLYRGEQAAAGSDPVPVSPWELATRLSYFLWSSVPDEPLRQLAATGQLTEPEVLAGQVRRMLQDPKVRRLALEFGCQWLQVRDVATLDEKSERHFPTFKSLRADMQEEVVRFFTDLFQADGSVLSLLDADHSYVNAALAEHYGLQTTLADWQRVSGMRAHQRGGILGFAAALAKQSGASRTSPILRGIWLSEVLLGEKLPTPPKDIPVLPEETPAGLTERALTERHSSDPACAGCHRRIDPFGFALEGFDAIGRWRERDANGLPIDTVSTLADGTEFEGLEGVRTYLLHARREDFLRQFCRKLLGFALGRSVQLSDRPLLDTMLQQLEKREYRVSTAVELIVQSPQFQRVRGQDFVAAD